MKKIVNIARSFAYILAALLATTVFFACDGGDGNADGGDGGVTPDTFFVDWQDGGFKKEYGLKTTPGGGDWYKTPPVTRNGYTLKGIYSERNGVGERIFDSVGNRISEPQGGKTYYACWQVNTVSVSFRFSETDKNAYRFTDGSTRICRQYVADSPIDFVFPEIDGDHTVSYWKSNGKRISDGNVIYSEYKTISDLMVDGDSAFVNMYPVFETPSYTVTLTLDYGNRTESVDLTYGDGIADYLVTYTQDGRELVGWTADRYDDEAIIEDPAPLKKDLTLYAVWREFSEIVLYGVDENYFDDGYAVPSEDSRDDTPFCFKRIYEYRPEYLATPKRDGYVFAGWYESADFSGQPVSRLVSREVNCGEYYAKWVYAERTINVRYNTGNGIRTVKVVLRVDETLRLKADLSALAAPAGQRVKYLLKGNVPCTDENGYWTDGDAPSPDYTAYYGAEVG